MLATKLILHFLVEVILVQYVDNVLLVSADPQRLREETTLLTK